VDLKRQQNIRKSKNFFRKFFKPFIATYIFFSVAISFYPTFDFYSFKGQLLILSVSTFNGAMGLFVKKL
tara:strand:+ start:646 stop:852 length:207 start_codon:yes stop_codon:yes gene_type:complete